MKLFFLLTFILFIHNSKASFPETFGASYSTSMIGNQSNLDPNDPSNNYYAPAILGFSERVNFLIQATSNVTSLKPIDNIAVTNSSNSTTGTTYGSANTDYPKFYGTGLHFGLPIGYPEKGTIGTLGLSVYLPIGGILETNSGNPFLPEYVMYHSRFQRTSVYLNFAHKLSDEWAFSIGGLLGYEASADVNADLSLNGSSYGSWAQARSRINPSLGAIISIAHKGEISTQYFTYQQEMKSNLSAHASGEVSNPSLALLDTTISTVMFYDPHTFRLGSDYRLGQFDFYSALEFQLWSNYRPPVINIVKNGGVIVPSSNYEFITTQNTINPRVGLRYHFTNRIIAGLGLMYRQTPLKGDFSNSGNSIDTDSYILTTGLSYRIVIWSKDVTIGVSFEYHALKDRTVTKTPGQEDGTAGTKLGGPSYAIGGHLLSESAGIKFNF